MKKALCLLSGLLLSGCGGFYPQVNQLSLTPAPAQLFRELSLLPVDRVDFSPSRPSGNNLEPRIQSLDEPPQKTNPEIDFGSRNEPARSITAQGEDELQMSDLILEPLLFSASKEDGGSAVQSSPSAKLEKSPKENFPSVASEGLQAEKEEGKPSAGKPLDEIFKESLSLSTTGATGDGGERVQERYLPLEMGAYLPSDSPAAAYTQKSFPQNNPSSKILASFPTLLNERVKRFIDLFQTKADTFFTKSLARSQVYEDMMKKIFREKNLPEELFYLALIESGFNPYAQSRAKACGIWQFMSNTAKRFGLKVDKWVDERRDPEKSTYAAAEYLKRLHEMFNCWYLATASYNAGEGKVLQAMRRAKSQDFWEISKYRYLKRETKEYVPLFLAAMTIAQDPQKYGFSRIDYHPPLSYEKVVVPPGTRLDRIARAAETDIAEIRALNPSLRRDKTPPDGSPFEMKLPPGKKEIFESNFFKITKIDFLNAKKHQVCRGETLGQIAKKHQVSLQELCKFNQISPQAPIKPGLTLLIPP